MEEAMKHDFYVSVVRKVALDNVPLRNNPSSQNFGEEPMQIFFVVKNFRKCPNKMISCSIERPQVASFILINVLEIQWLSVTDNEIMTDAMKISIP